MHGLITVTTKEITVDERPYLSIIFSAKEIRTKQFEIKNLFYTTNENIILNSILFLNSPLL